LITNQDVTLDDCTLIFFRTTLLSAYFKILSSASHHDLRFSMTHCQRVYDPQLTFRT